jgi:hypothetical protein
MLVCSVSSASAREALTIANAMTTLTTAAFLNDIDIELTLPIFEMCAPNGFPPWPARITSDYAPQIGSGPAISSVVSVT